VGSGLPLSTEDKRNVLRRVSGEIFGQGRVDAVDELLAPDFVDHDPLPGVPPTRDGVKQLVGMFRTAFPDFEVEVLHTVVEGDKAVDHISSTGTHLGEFLGVAPTGKRIATSAIVLSLLNDEGQIEARWQRFGAMQLLQQLGVVPGWEEPPPVPPIPTSRAGPRRRPTRTAT
jgi:predicted ester cyclase